MNVANLSMRGKVALITGGARGIGRATAEQIVAGGGQVVIADVQIEDGEALARQLGDAAAFFELDVTSEQAWAAAVAFAIERFGRLNILVNNAGIANSGSIKDFDAARWQRVIDVNLTGPYLGIRAAHNALIAGAPSAIVNVSSAAGMQGQARFHGYCASKFGLRGLTKSVAMELAPHNVRCNSVHPGAVRTPLTEGLDLGPASGPFGRPADSNEIANLIVYLASDSASYSTGAEFIADGGLLAGRGPPSTPAK